MLQDDFRVSVLPDWKGEPADVLMALHARKSSESIRAFRKAFPAKPIILVLTGTDLYHDYPGNPQAVESMQAADRLVVLQDDAPRLLPPDLRRKSVVIFQSSPVLRTLGKRKGVLRAVAVGHLRAEKDPQTLWRAVADLPVEQPISVLHVGKALDPALARPARETARRDPRYRWCGPLPHGLARIAIQRAHVLVHPSRLEGGANVIVEAVNSGTPVLASRMSGNVGMLGASYPGYFEVGDAASLARLLQRCLESPGFLGELRAACRLRRKLFSPDTEAKALIKLARGILK